MKKQTRWSKFKYEISWGFARFRESAAEIKEGLNTFWWGVQTIFQAFKFEKPKDYGPPMSAEEYEALHIKRRRNWEKRFDEIVYKAAKATVVIK